LIVMAFVLALLIMTFLEPSSPGSMEPTLVPATACSC
jgi:hypothetical protein